MMKLRCGACYRVVLVPNPPTKSADCPSCNERIVIVDEKSGAVHFGEGVYPAWRQSVGNTLAWLGLAFFFISFVIGGNYQQHSFDPLAGLVVAVLNPLAWVVLIWGLSWCGREKRSRKGP